MSHAKLYLTVQHIASYPDIYSICDYYFKPGVKSRDARATELLAVALIICWFSVWKLHHIALLAPRILRWFLGILKMRGPLF